MHLKILVVFKLSKSYIHTFITDILFEGKFHYKMYAKVIKDVIKTLNIYIKKYVFCLH